MRKRWRGKLSKGSCAVASAVAAIALIGLMLSGRIWLRELGAGGRAGPAAAYAAAIADARRAGIPTTSQELQAPLPPAEQNAAPLYTRIADLLAAHPLSGPDEILELMSAHGMPSADQCARARQALKRRSALVALIHQAATRPQCVFVRDWSYPNAILYREETPMRAAAKLLGAESAFLAHAGRPLDAVRTDALIFNMARQTSSSIPYAANGSAHNMQRLALWDLQRILYRMGGRADVADAVRALIEQQCRPGSLSAAFREEAGTHIVDIEVLRSQGSEGLTSWIGDSSSRPLQMLPGDWNRLIDDNGLLLLRMERRAADVADLPYWKSSRVMAGLNQQLNADQDRRHILVLNIWPGSEYTIVSRTLLQAEAEVTRSGAAILAWKARHGALPASLAQALSPAPTDPFDGRPLRYRREGAGFVVYSVGETLRYAAGTPKQRPGREVQFRYPLPSYYAVPVSEK
jgi:hypothetical protein